MRAFKVICLGIIFREEQAKNLFPLKCLDTST